MTPSEFKAWFDGFTEAIADIGPTTAQWARVKARVAEIDGKPVTERVYVDRYWPEYRRYYGNAWPAYYTSNTTGAALSATIGSGGMSGNLTAGQASGGTMNLNASNAGAMGNQSSHGTMSFDGAQAMGALGRAEAQTLKAGA